MKTPQPSIDDYRRLGNSVRERIGELMIDLDHSVQVDRHCTDELTWTRDLLRHLSNTRADILALLGDGGFDNRVRRKP